MHSFLLENPNEIVNYFTGISDHSSDRSSLAATKKLFRKMYVSDSGDQSNIPPLMVQYLDSQKMVMKTKLMQGDTSTTSDETDRAPETFSDITSYPVTGRDTDLSSTGPPTCESDPNQSMITPREFDQDQLVSVNDINYFQYLPGISCRCFCRPKFIYFAIILNHLISGNESSSHGTRRLGRDLRR